MKRFTAVVVKEGKVTENKIQCISTEETYLGSTVWLDESTGKKYYISKMYRKSCFIEVKRR